MCENILISATEKLITFRLHFLQFHFKNKTWDTLNARIKRMKRKKRGRRRRNTTQDMINNNGRSHTHTQTQI